MAVKPSRSNFLLLITIVATAAALTIFLQLLSYCGGNSRRGGAGLAKASVGHRTLVLPRQLAQSVHIRGGAPAAAADGKLSIESPFLDLQYRDVLFKAVAAVADDPALQTRDAHSLASIIAAAVEQLLRSQEGDDHVGAAQAHSARNGSLLIDGSNGQGVKGSAAAGGRLKSEQVASDGGDTVSHAVSLPGGQSGDARLTHETCYQHGDESEVCEYHGTICFDGEGPVALVEGSLERKLSQRGRAEPAPSSSVVSGCADESSDVTWPPSHHTLAAAVRCRYQAAMQGKVPTAFGPVPLPATSLATDVAFRHAATSEVFHPPQLGWAGVSGDKRAVNGAGLPLLDSREIHTPDGDVITVDYLDGALWMVPLPAGALADAFAWAASATSPLFAAQRANSTGGWGGHPMDGIAFVPGPGASYIGQMKSINTVGELLRYGGPQGVHTPGDIKLTDNSATWRVGPQWGPLPPMDTVLFVGAGAAEAGVGQSVPPLTSWHNATLTLASQHHTRHVYAPQLQAKAGYSRSHLLCARRGVLTSPKPRLHSDFADAWMWRQYNYMAAGLSAKGVMSHTIYPPRRITLVLGQEEGMTAPSLLNRPEVEAAVRATGLPVTVVDTIEALPFARRAELMSGSGILIALHSDGSTMTSGATLLPAHSVLIELFPPGVRDDTHRRIAAQTGLHHYPLYTRARAPHTKEGPAASAAAAPLIVPIHYLTRLLDDAVDAIGAYSLLNPAWNVEATAAGMPPPTKLAYISSDPDTEMTEELTSVLAAGRKLATEYVEKQKQQKAAA